MKRLFFIAIILLAQVLICATHLYAQDDKIQKEYDTHIDYTYAERYYEYGYFDQAISILNKLQISQDATIRSSAYRLKALCHIEMGDIDQAKVDVEKLLAADPYFSPSASDNPIFLRLINTNKKTGSATITTASQQAETIEESPVPVTLITEEMLKMIGARTLKDALIAFVPGMTDVASNEEMNIAMRGIYSSGQEKILFLLNGHRMNSYSTNVATPDFSMSLEKVKQIEVLRGPASSIYGGVALTGVVNIITKDGLDVDGLKVKASAGNHGQIRGDVLFGKRYLDLDILVWAGVYNSSGEKYHIAGDAVTQPYALVPVEGDAIIGAYNRKPTYDIGLDIKYKKFSLFYNRRNAKTVSEFALSSAFTPYSYNDYLKYNGNAPGNAVTSNHAEVAFEDNKGKFSWFGKLFLDTQMQQRLQIVGDTIVDFGDFTTMFPYGSDDRVRMDKGGFQCVLWDETTFGLKLGGNYAYKFSKNNSGNISFGGEVSRFSLNDSKYFEGYNFTNIIKTFNTEKNLAEVELPYPKYLSTGSETQADGFVQLKHNINNIIYFNAGVRYDYKKRRLGKEIHQFSPRLAVIYNGSKTNLKFSYAKSFVDAPYYFRSNCLDVEFGSEDLQPEIMNSFQLSFLSNGKLVKNLSLDANIFYNQASNFIVSNGNYVFNAGKLSTGGIEIVANYTIGNFAPGIVATYQRVLDSKDYSVSGIHIYDVPNLQMNVHLNYIIAKCITLHLNSYISSRQESLFKDIEGEIYPLSTPARCTFDAGINYVWKKLSLDANVHNLFNKRYSQGGSSVAPLIQPGTWFLIGVGYKL